MSEYYETETTGEGYGEPVEYTEYADGGIGLGLTEAVSTYAEAGHADGGYTEEGHAEEGYTEEGHTEEGYGTDTGYADGGDFYANNNIDTAVSTNPGGDEGYIALGDGEFVSWG